MPWNTAGNIKGPKGDKGDPGNAADVAALIHAAASKTPVDADELPLLDSAGSWGLRKFTWYTLKTLLQALFFYRGNIVGTVSQTAGAPTGAIIQRGSNANGEFVRFADGTQICTRVATYSISLSSQGTQNLADWTFPVAFFSISYADFKLRGADAVNVHSNLYTAGTTGGTPQLRNLTTSSISGSSTEMMMIAVGRWF